MQLLKKSVLMFLCLTLTSCIGGVWTGANLFYDRHHVFKKTTDLAIAAQIGHKIKLDPSYACPTNTCFEIAAFHSDLLLLGWVASVENKERITELAKTVTGVRHVYNYISVATQDNPDTRISDAWITTQIRSKVLANADIDPEPFKVVSYQQIVYLLGDVLDNQETLIINIAKDTAYVEKVVDLMQTYTLTHQPKKMTDTGNE